MARSEIHFERRFRNIVFKVGMTNILKTNESNNFNFFLNKKEYLLEATASN